MMITLLCIVASYQIMDHLLLCFGELMQVELLSELMGGFRPLFHKLEIQAKGG